MVGLFSQGSEASSTDHYVAHFCSSLLFVLGFSSFRGFIFSSFGGLAWGHGS